MNLCEICKERKIRYELTLAEDVICPHCNYTKRAKGSEKMLLCSTKCPMLYIWVTEYVSKSKDTAVKVRYCLEKDECIVCGKKDWPEVLFTGIRIVSPCKGVPGGVERRSGSN